MKTKTLPTQEVKNRVRKTISEVVSKLFNFPNDTTKRNVRASLGELMQDDRILFRAAFVHEMKRLINSGVKGKGKRCTEEELESVLTQIRAHAPELASALRKDLKNLQGQLPRRGGPGRDEILSPTEKREVCEQVGSLHKMGKTKTMSEIFTIVAETLRIRGKKISARTIKRVWENRATLYVE